MRIGKAVVGGFVGTVVMTFMMYFVAPMMLGKPMDVAGMLGTMLGGSWAGGMAMHFLNGTIVFPLLYAFVLYDVFPGAPWLRGTTLGVTLWLLSQIVVTPLMGGGFFSANAGGAMAVMASLIGHAIYGLVLGTIGGPAGDSPTRTHAHAAV